MYRCERSEWKTFENDGRNCLRRNNIINGEGHKKTEDVIDHEEKGDEGCIRWN